jgi:hypothetical protein
MRTIPDQLKSRNLVPFKKGPGRYKIPGVANEHEVLMDRVDTDLSPEEQGFIRHYLGYADALLRGVEHTVPELREQVGTQNGKEEVTKQPAHTKANSSSKVA